MRKDTTHNLTVAAMLSAVAFILMFIEFPIPMLIPSFVKMDFSDLPALLGAFALGPVYGVVISFMKNLLHIVIKGTSTAGVGELCNFMLGAVFSAVAGFIYKHHKSRKTAIIGAVAGAAAMAIFSVPSNYFITYPAYVQFYHMPLEAILGLYKLALVVFQLAMTLLACKGLYAASDLADLLLASCSPEIRSNKTLLSLLDTSYKVLVVVLCVAALAQEVGFPIGSIVAGAGLVGLTISLAAQESASNLFSGIVILLDKPFSVGDWITVGDVEGEVIAINFRSTRIRSLDKTINVVTNSKICSSTVQNAALRTMRPYKFNLGVTYGTTRPKLEQLMADLKAMLDESPYTNKGTNIVQLVSFGDSSINILVSAYLTTNAYTEFLQMQIDLNLNIMDIMQADGVDFAFPSTSVYIEKK